MTEKEQKKAAKEFAARWKDKGYEKGESQKFWIDLLVSVFGVEDIAGFISFEDQVHLDHTSFIDGYIKSTHVMIEQKSLGKDLRKAIRQSDGTLLNPFQQAKRYSAELPYDDRPRWIITCNFAEFLVYDMNKPNGEPEQILLKDLAKDYYRLQFLVQQKSEIMKKEEEISMQAGELVGRLYDAILKQYKDPESPDTLKSLNMLCVRLVFCLYAEDAGIFGAHEMFGQYLQQFPVKEVHKKLRELFKVLDMTDEKREEYDPYMDKELAAFPYVNGGLFADENIIIPPFTDEIVDILVNKASAGFDWSEISPTIFGAVFESTLNPETRRSGGMHYTSIENIHKVIDPLFLDGLKAEYNDIIENTVQLKAKRTKLDAFEKKLAALVFFDPACGSGNFLTETYISLRRLENMIIDEINQGQMQFGAEGEYNPIKVSIGQFYGIEINDFAVTVAKTALWIAESQMLHETEEIIQQDIDFLPLKSYANITQANALRIDWESVVPKDKLSYIMGNPPFVGARFMNGTQKADLFEVFDGVKNSGNLDYVSCWYKKSACLMDNTQVRTALVSTNSITQGEQVAILWKNLFESGVHIDFAHRTFRWDSEASLKAHVHCVIIGFSIAPNDAPKQLFDNGAKKIVKSINGYLIEADNIIVDNRNNPLCNVPSIGIGNKPIDGGYYLFTEEEKQEFIINEPKSESYFKQWIGAREYINGIKRYCLWLGECSPKELRTMPECLKRVELVRQYRLNSTSEGTRKIADKPTRFHVENMPKGHFLVIPQVSSERRKYIPIGYLDDSVLCSDKVRIMPDATLFHFGILTSNVHMAWMRAICCRLKSDYSYTVNNVYNTFPWPTPTADQKTAIEHTAQMILDARAKYPDCSLADLYDETTMPPELRKAHQLNDKAVMQAYGFWNRLNTEAECVAELMKMYQKLTSGVKP
ncbi:Methyltransferase domain-containing protein [Ruminococcaceae bacterium FB2012]|nr:Methyltransferase domain-containing protein [Ruminococcaceae bacterium FB2012]